MHISYTLTLQDDLGSEAIVNLVDVETRDQLRQVLAAACSLLMDIRQRSQQFPEYEAPWFYSVSSNSKPDTEFFSST